MGPEGAQPAEDARLPAADPRADAAVMDELRNGWLGEYEAFLSRPAPPRLSWSTRLRRRLAAMKSDLAAVRELRSREGAEAAARERRAPEEQRDAATRREPASAPVMPAGPIAPPVQEPVLLELRDEWVADAAANPEKHAPKRLPWYRELYGGFEPLVDEFAYWTDCLTALAHRQMTPKRERRRVARGERARRADVAARALSAMIVIAFAVGVVVYVSIVVHIFNPKQLARLLSQ